MVSQRTARLSGIALIVLPILAVALARAMTFSDWAAANALVAALLFTWIVADSLVLATMARAPDHRPGAFAVTGMLAVAALIILTGAGGTVREAIFAMPPLVGAAMLTIALFVVWSALRFLHALKHGDGLEQAAIRALPGSAAAAIRFAIIESRVMRLALFGWRRDQDIPAGAEGFSYHRYLMPMVWVVLVLQGIELAAMHVLLRQWSPVVAWIWFGLGVAGGLWTVGLTQGFRIYPVLLAPDGVRVRSSILFDVLIPYDAIAGLVSGFGGEQVKANDTLNQAVLSWPNVMLALKQPVDIRPLIGRERQVNAVAMRIDESGAFVAALAKRVPTVQL